MPKWEDKGVDEEGFHNYSLDGFGRFVATVSCKAGEGLGTFVAVSGHASKLADQTALEHGKRVAEDAVIALQRKEAR